MKKILSCALVLVMAFALFAVQASAATGTVVLSATFDKSAYKVGDTGTLKVTITVDNDTDYVAGGDLYFNAVGFTPADALSGLTQKDGDMAVGDVQIVDNGSGVYQINYISAKNGALGNVTMDIPITIADDATEVSIAFNFDDSYLMDAESDFILDSGSSTGAKATIASSKPVVVTKGEATIKNGITQYQNGEYTDVQIGAYVVLPLTIAEDANITGEMLWSLTTANGKLYSVNPFNTGLSALTGDVKIAATFVTGTHDGKGAVVSNNEITDVNAILKATDGTIYCTDAADEH